ncbi:hypothetical protein RD792_002679 [Penstemon davidsonii]|uniref:Inositol-1-monophosphatase n=1 Tax=Penstemon davidsonii TaxID=160366 RepID=A0ABR0DRN2_9LAMI|nr:hypothetical protein RD792_002679 [Penstemon davidsonii]
MAVDAAKKAGEIIRFGFYETKHVEHKGQVDLVTETDKKCEEIIFNFLKLHYPDHKLFTAIRGKGAFLNGKPIKASSQNELVKSLLATEVGTKRDKSTVDATTNKINSLLFKVRSLRMSGSCALNLCGIACGRLDLFYEHGFGGPWDVAAGAVIASEAGGVVFDPSGSDFDITSQRVAASNPLLKDAFIEALQQSE